MASDSSCDFRPGTLHIFFTDTQNTNERCGRQKKRTNTGLGQLQAQERLCDTFEQLTACILRETSTKPLGMLTHLLTVFSVLLSSSPCLLLPTVSFSGQLSQADCSLLPSFVNCFYLSSLAPSFPPPLPSRGRS